MLEALKYGAFDFVEKPSFDNLKEIVKRGIEWDFDHSSKEGEENKLLTDNNSKRHSICASNESVT